MYEDFQTPDAPPEAKTQTGFAESPIQHEIEFHGRKSQPHGTVGKLTAGDLDVAFKVYIPSKEQGVSGDLTELRALTFYVLGVYSKFAGVDFNTAKPKESDRFTSTLYRGPKDLMYFRQGFVKEIRENRDYANRWKVGNYAEVRAFTKAQDYGEKVGYKKMLLVWCEQLKCICEMVCSRRVEYGMAAAIAIATKTAHNAGRIGGLNDLSTQFWGFHFAGDFHTVADVKGGECIPFSGKSEWGFAPVFKCGVIKDTAEKFQILAEAQMEVDNYVDSQIKWAEAIAGVVNENNEPQNGTAQPTPHPHPGSGGQQRPDFVPFPDAPPPVEMAGAFENVAYPDDWNN